MKPLALSILVLLLLVPACKSTKPPTPPTDTPPQSDAAPLLEGAPDGDEDDGESEGDGGDEECGGEELTVTFYDAGQALAALITLPDGRHVLVDTGESPNRPGCSTCDEWHKRVVDGLKADLGGGEIDLVWITHQHSDHHGGLRGIADAGIKIKTYVDNGQEPTKNGVKKAREAATDAGATLSVVKPGQTGIPIQDAEEVDLEAVVPDQWPVVCKDHPNDCSIGLQISYCKSSILFTGDGEGAAEAAWEVDDIDLLQVGHHGSATSSSTSFLAKVQPNYAVVSSGKVNDGTNKGYCHPRLKTVNALNGIIGGSTQGWVLAFDAAVKCADAESSNWKQAPTSSTTWYTSRDGEVTLVTKGDGKFTRALP